MGSIPDQPTSMHSIEALERAVAVANRHAARRTVIIISAVVLVVLLGVGGLAFYLGKNLEESIATYRIAYSDDNNLSITRGGYLIDNRSRIPITRLVNEMISVATFSSNGHIALTTEGPYTAFSLIKELVLGLGPRDRARSDEIFIFDSSGARLQSFRTGTAPKALIFSPDNKTVLAYPQDGAPTIWSLQGQLVATIKTEGPIRFLDFSPNGNYVLAVPRKGAVTVSNLRGQLLATIKTEEPFSFAAFSPEDNHSMVVATTDGTFLIWDISNDSLIRQIKGPNARALVIGFRSGGQQIAVVYEQPPQVKVWDVESGREASSEFSWTETMPRARTYLIDD
jgi:WD40 repeat protein